MGARSGYANALRREASFHAGGTGGGGFGGFGGIGGGGGGGSNKRQKLDNGGHHHHAPLKRIQQAPAAVPPPEMPEAPTRLVGEILLGTLGDVLGKVFGVKTSFSSVSSDGAGGAGGSGAGAAGPGPGAGADAVAGEGANGAAAANGGDADNGDGGGAAAADDAGVTNAEAAAVGRERLMSLSEEVTRWLPDLASVEDDSPVGGGRATREPTVDRTALKAEVDSVFVAAKAAEATWKRYTEAHVRAAGGATRAKTAAVQCEAARAELAGAKLAREAMTNGAVDLDPSLRAMVQGQINEKITRASELVSNLQSEVTEANATEAEARGQAATAGRAFRPPYEEVRKRALRLRLAAEERAERQIGRALSRAERDLQNKTAKLRDLREMSAGVGAAGGGGGGGGGEDGGTNAAAAGVTPKEKQLAELERRLEVAGGNENHPCRGGGCQDCHRVEQACHIQPREILKGAVIPSPSLEGAAV